VVVSNARNAFEGMIHTSIFGIEYLKHREVFNMILRKELGGSNWIVYDVNGQVMKKFQILDTAIAWAFDNNMVCNQINRQAFVLKQVKPKRAGVFEKKMHLSTV